jgi:hypothetical protein
MPHDYNLTAREGKFEVHISASTHYGYFEHADRGGDRGGGLWFEDNNLIDYDGVAVLPHAVIKAVRSLGYEVEDIFE